MGPARKLLEDLGPILQPARKVRDLNRRKDFDDLETELVSRAARNLRAIAYSCTEGAKLLEAVIRDRVG